MTIPDPPRAAGLSVVPAALEAGARAAPTGLDATCEGRKQALDRPGERHSAPDAGASGAGGGMTPGGSGARGAISEARSPPDEDASAD